MSAPALVAPVGVGSGRRVAPALGDHVGPVPASDAGEFAVRRRVGPARRDQDGSPPVIDAATPTVIAGFGVGR